MAAWTLIAVAVVTCWTCFLALGWLLCRAASRGDEDARPGVVVELRTPERLTAAHRR
jgi:hypothetical protein